MENKIGYEQIVIDLSNGCIEVYYIILFVLKIFEYFYIKKFRKLSCGCLFVDMEDVFNLLLNEKLGY